MGMHKADHRTGSVQHLRHLLTKWMLKLASSPSDTQVILDVTVLGLGMIGYMDTVITIAAWTWSHT